MSWLRPGAQLKTPLGSMLAPRRLDPGGNRRPRSAQSSWLSASPAAKSHEAHARGHKSANSLDRWTKKGQQPGRRGGHLGLLPRQTYCTRRTVLVNYKINDLRAAQQESDCKIENKHSEIERAPLATGRICPGREMLAQLGVVSLLCDARRRPQTRRTEPLPVSRQSPPSLFSFARCALALTTTARACSVLAACGLAAAACKTESDPQPPTPASSASGASAAPRASATVSNANAPPTEALMRPRNVLLLTIDSLRADMPWAGYPRAIAPNLTKPRRAERRYKQRLCALQSTPPRASRAF